MKLDEFDLDAARRLERRRKEREAAAKRMASAPTLESLPVGQGDVGGFLGIPAGLDPDGLGGKMDLDGGSLATSAAMGLSDAVRAGASAAAGAAAAVRDAIPAPIRGMLGALSAAPAAFGSQLTPEGRALHRRAWEAAILTEQERKGRPLTTMEALALLPGVGTLGREAFDPERKSSIGGVAELVGNIATDPTIAATGGARAGVAALGSSVARQAPQAGRLATAAQGAANVLGSAPVAAVYAPDIAEGVARGVENADPAAAMGMGALGGLMGKGIMDEARQLVRRPARAPEANVEAPAATPERVEIVPLQSAPQSLEDRVAAILGRQRAQGGDVMAEITEALSARPSSPDAPRYSLASADAAPQPRSPVQEWVSAATGGRLWQPAIETVRRHAPGLAARLERYNHVWETRASRDVAAYVKILNKLGPAGEAREKLFREQVVPLLEHEGQGDFRDFDPRRADPIAREVAQDIRQLLDQVADKAKAQGVLSGYRRRYFPHMAADEDFRSFESMVRRYMAAKKLTDFDKAVEQVNEIRAEMRKRQTGGRMMGNIERTREGALVNAETLKQKYGLTDDQLAAILPQTYRTDTDVLTQYLIGANRRIAETAFLGKRHETATRLLNTIADQRARAAVEKVLARMTGTDAVDPLLREASDAARAFQANTRLGAAAPLQLGSIVPTAMGASSAGVGRAVRTTLAEAWGTLTGDKGIRGLADLRRNIDAAKLDVMDSGAIFTALADETSDAFGARAPRAPWLRAIGAIDTTQRVIAARVMRAVLPEWVARARAGDQGAVRDLERLRVPWQSIDASNASDPAVKAAMKRFADETQLRTGVADIPIWASSPVGRVAFQFSNFAYAASRKWVAPAFQDFARGDRRKLAVLLAAGAVAGEGVADLRALLYGKSVAGEEEIDTRDFDPTSPRSWIRLLRQVQDKAFRTDRIKANNPAGALARAIQNLATLGAFGIAQTVLERGARGADSPVGFVLGPTGSSFQDLVIEPLAEALKGDPAGAGRQLMRGVAAHVPVFGNQIQREIESSALGEALGFDRRDRPGNAGWVGRARDLMSPPEGTEMTREQVRQIEAERDRLKRISDRVPRGLPQKAPVKRLAVATARAKKEAYLLEIRDLIRQSRNREARALLNRARAEGLWISESKVREGLEDKEAR